MTSSHKLIVAAAVALLASAPALEAAAQVRGAGRSNVGHGGGAHAGAPRSPGGGGGRAEPGRNGGGVHNNTVNRGGNNSGNRGNNNRINTGDVNINVDNDHHDHGYDWDDHYHPVATGVAIGTAAAVTSAVIGSMVYSLPPSCSPYAGSYYYCGGVYYAPQYQGDTITYVVVDRP